MFRGFYKCKRGVIQCRRMASSSMPMEEVSLYGGGWDSGPGAVKVSVWWDFENCNIPLGVSPSKIGNNIVSALRIKGFKGPVSISAYGDTWQLSRSTQEALACTGISLHHLPSNRKTDRTFMVDLVLWTLDHPPPAHLFVISTDGELSSALHSLRMKNYNVLLACNSHAASPALLAAATSVWPWTNLATGEGLLLQVTVETKDSQTPKEFLQGLSSLTHTPLCQPVAPAAVSESTQSFAGKSFEAVPPAEVESDQKALQDPLDDFHKDVCKLLQQAASSLNEKSQDKIRVSGKLRTKVGQDGNSQTTAVSIQQTTRELVTDSSYSVTRMENGSGSSDSTSSEENVHVAETGEGGELKLPDCSQPGKVDEAADTGSWTWKGFFFGRRSSHQPETELPASAAGMKRSWFSSLWKKKPEEDPSERKLREYLETEEAATLLNKSRSPEEFVEMLNESGPAWIKDLQQDRVSQVVDDKAFEAWLESSDAPEDSNSTSKTGNQVTWESGKGHYPSIEELRIWLIYFLEVEQEGRSFDVSLLKLEFRRNFGVPLQLQRFGCLRMKELLAIMQDRVDVHYPKPTVCSIRSKVATGFREKRRFQPSSLADYSGLLQELFMDYPMGIPVCMVKPRFYGKFGCDIDHQKLGYSNLGDFLTAAREDMELKLDEEESLCVYIPVRL